MNWPILRNAIRAARKQRLGVLLAALLIGLALFAVSSAGGILVIGAVRPPQGMVKSGAATRLCLHAHRLVIHDSVFHA